MRKLLFLLAAACAPTLPPPDQPGARDAYRAVLSQEGKGPRKREAREKLEIAEWDAARAAHTIFAYRKYLKEFEDTRHAPEARQLLEGLRWTAADEAGTEAALAGYLEDEPRGAHAAEAWSRLSALRLTAALQAGDAVALRAWLAENPSSPGREKAVAMLDDLEWRAAADQAAWRRYLDQHPDGTHRAEAQASIERAEREDAEVLEDEARLRALADPAADRIVYQRAAALLDEGKLAQLARRKGPYAAEAARDLAFLSQDEKRAGLLESAAQKLFLPRATLDELPESAPARALRLAEWARALDGSRLHRMLAEFASPRASVAMAALDGVESLLQGLPQAEERIRAARELALLQPIAVDGPQLAAVAVLQLALGQDAAALDSARTAASRSPRCAPAVWLQARLETEPALKQIALQSLRVQGRDLAAAHAGSARKGDLAAVVESCVALRACERAADRVPEAVAEARAIGQQVEEGRGHMKELYNSYAPDSEMYRLYNSYIWRDAICTGLAGPDPDKLADERLEAARLLVSAATPVARPALERAAARDPDLRVRSAAGGAVAIECPCWDRK